MVDVKSNESTATSLKIWFPGASDWESKMKGLVPRVPETRHDINNVTSVLLISTYTHIHTYLVLITVLEKDN